MITRKTIIGAKIRRVWLILGAIASAIFMVINTVNQNPASVVFLIATVLMGCLFVVHNGTIHRLVAQQDQEELRIWRRGHSPDYEAIDALDMELSGQTFYHSKAPDYLPEEEFLASQASGKEAGVAAHAEIQKQTEASTEEAMRTPDQRVIASQPCGCYQMATGFVSMCDIHAARKSRKNTHRLVSGELATLSKALRENPPECGCTNYGPDQVFLCDKHAGLTRQLADEARLWGLSKSGAIKSAQTEVARRLADEAGLAENRRKLAEDQLSPEQQEIWDQLAALRERERKLGSW